MPKSTTVGKVKKISKLFIANRGEIAVRAAKACEERKIAAVIPYASSDAYSLVTRMADKNRHLGWKLAPLSGTSADETYANPKKILDAAILHGCDAIFLGYGFLSEKDEFVEMCEKAGIRTLSPHSHVMRLTGNKIAAREIAKKIKTGIFATIPILEGTPHLDTFEDGAKWANRLGYPVMMKDPDLGGGVGNIVAGNETELKQAYTKLRMHRNNKSLFLERYIQRAVHVEVQILGDEYGNIISLGERDCTMQRRSQKILEESPSPHITPLMRKEIQEAAVTFAKSVNYSSVGTWEFIVDMDRRGIRNDFSWYFMEINPRIQVEHGVTEEQTGVDIVKAMIDVAEGKPLTYTQSDIKPKGHTIEARVYAENPDDNFKQSFGKLEVLTYPEFPGVRIDKGAEEGDEISPWFDPTICKVMAHGTTREEARRLLSEALLRMNIVGVLSNKDFLVELLNTDEFRNTKGSTTFIEKWWKEKLKKRIYDVSGIIAGGSYDPYSSVYQFDPRFLPQDVTVVPRNSEETISYSQYYHLQQEKTGEECAAEFGIVQRDGVQFVLYELDDRFAAGTLGTAEGIAFESACKLADRERLPLVTVSRSGGARQHENTLALYQMGATINALNRFPPLFHINIYVGGVYGGVPASFAGCADVQIAVNAKQTKIGFSGPYIVAKTLGKAPQSFSAEDAYKELPEGAHTPLHHFQTRTVDILVRSVEEASDKVTHLLHILHIPSTIVDPDAIFSPEEQISFQQLPGMAHRFDRPGMEALVWIRARLDNFLWDQEKRLISPKKVSYAPLPIRERRQILMEPNRPTAADFIDKRSGIFDDVISLTSVLHIDGAEQLPPVIAAIAQFDGKPLMILGQQTQSVKNDITGKKTKIYDPQKPADWEYTLKMVELAKKLQLPIVLLGDTLGADCLPESEDRNQSHKIAQVIKELDRYPYPVLSINIGFKGSGGGETFIRSFDAAADFENALSYVSDPMVQYWILTGRWIDKDSPKQEQEELTSFIDQLKDATSQVRLQTHQIDAIIPEGKGGAHKNPRHVARTLKKWLKKHLVLLEAYSSEELLIRRHKRIERVIHALTVSKEHPSTATSKKKK